MAQAFSTQAKIPLRILCFGDSLTAGTTQMFQLHPYAPHLQKALTESTKLQSLDIEVMHLGFPGWTSEDLLKDADGPKGLRTTISRNQEPPISLVILLAGTNDLGSSKSSSEISEGVISLHKLCLEEKVSNTIAIGIPSSFYQTLSSKASEVAKTANQGIESFCESDPRAAYFPFPFEYSKDDGNWDPDGLHFSAKGYQVLGESLAPAVEDIVAKQLNL
ncbi:unnamed protein product [Cylindrotheca closterium]|uniref:SGNH hydrolase-type esterase domain-containing protein n=1 Tax=Cylindrotheca closterium TaxID=2856 RepID=A0AAD2FVR7_9STRA|nr:unnamed protein product [Cylindrotheca closterium]